MGHIFEICSLTWLIEFGSIVLDWISKQSLLLFCGWFVRMSDQCHQPPFTCPEKWITRREDHYIM
jgi:hypothetical protein